MKLAVWFMVVAGAGCEALFGDDMGTTLPYTPVAALDKAEVAAAREFCVDEVNRYRATRGLPAIVRSSQLEDFADEGAAIDAYAEMPHTHFSTAPFPQPAQSNGENEIRNWDLHKYLTLRTVIERGFAKMWAEEGTREDGHFQNMINDFDEAGCGFYLDVPTQNVTIVQDFRKR